MDFNNINFLPELTPKKDEELIRLLTMAYHGQIQVFFAHVPLSIIVPFDLDYRPDLHEIGKESIDHVYDEAKKGNFRQSIVYQRGYWFILSDDYITLYATILGQPDCIGCFILGEFDHPLVTEIQIVSPEDVRQVLGI